MISPFREEHELFRQQCRRFVEKELAPHAREWATSASSSLRNTEDQGEIISWPRSGARSAPAAARVGWWQA
ncbi:MAG: acyl-CoA dehydrogenase family protein [Deltaproteobacteria bacterium]|nr:acyl-CoA dehydrogenase family protein [Deltaproteobacteria bacterium]